MLLAGVATPVPAQEPPKLEGQTITSAEFGGALLKLIQEAFVTPFEQATGAKVIIESPLSRAKLKAQVDSGNVIWDIYTDEASFIQQNCGTLFEKVDTAKFIDAGIDKRFVTNECGVATSIVPQVFAYNADKYADGAPASWADFFNLESFPGKRAIWNNAMSGILEAALLADGVPADKLYPLDLDRAFKKMDTIKDYIVWTPSTGGLTDALVNGQVDLSLIFGARAYAAAKAGANVHVVPDQQILSWDQYAVVKGSKNKAAAEAYLQFIAGAGPQAKLTEIASFASANTKGNPKIDELVARFLPVQDKAVFVNHDWWAANFDAVNQRFVAWQSK
ncbi:extracellular solute-binding protein [Rhizobium leguminosarum]|uniref:extracellular solute-binding protein n=1 Tax=Rhizobium leguminosarum TaxID=384 RepID=UPI0024A95620|nr:extracellular solute-binding protein [Rhizobium leguminosarum]MDI5929669.1 extracellular solute-binding protein [Rhizobium leguminosarum]